MEIDMMMDICNRMERDMRMDNDIEVKNMNDELVTYNKIKPIYDTRFDFVESSKEWLANKISIGQGQYKYVCGTITKTGNKCKNKPIVDEKCYLHCVKKHKHKAQE